MLTRDYEVKYHEDADVTTFELIEPRLGRKNIYGWGAYNLCEKNAEMQHNADVIVKIYNDDIK